MPNIGSVLKEEISRLSRRELRKEVGTTKKATTQHRHHIAALNRKVVELERQVALLNRKVLAAPAPGPNGTPQRHRFVAKGLRSHRERLGLSAADFGKLVGVSAQSIYNWESGTATPGNVPLARLALLRKMGRREAAKRLEQLQSAKPAARSKS
jgi:DNA-binding XRE family transcriptional regulator